MDRYFCPVAFGFIKEEKCRMICDAMDNRSSGWNALPLGVTKTAWTQKRCRGCRRHCYADKSVSP